MQYCTAGGCINVPVGEGSGIECLLTLNLQAGYVSRKEKREKNTRLPYFSVGLPS
jgi:hypothetical protein